MASSAWWAFGSELQIGTTKVAEIIDINGPSMSRDAIETTKGDGTVGDGYRTFLPGFRDGGEISITGNWVPADTTHDGSQGLLHVFEDLDTLQAFVIETSSSPVVAIGFSGILTSFNVDLPLEEQGKLDCTIKISGAVTFT